MYVHFLLDYAFVLSSIVFLHFLILTFIHFPNFLCSGFVVALDPRTESKPSTRQSVCLSVMYEIFYFTQNKNARGVSVGARISPQTSNYHMCSNSLIHVHFSGNAKVQMAVLSSIHPL